MPLISNKGCFQVFLNKQKHCNKYDKGNKMWCPLFYFTLEYVYGELLSYKREKIRIWTHRGLFGAHHKMYQS